MTTHDVIRAWKDAAYRARLSESARATIPLDPAGTANLEEDRLATVRGGAQAAGPFGTFFRSRRATVCTTTAHVIDPGVEPRHF